MIIRWIILSIALFVTNVINVYIFAVLMALTIGRGITNLLWGKQQTISGIEVQDLMKTLTESVQKSKEFNDKVMFN